MVRAANGEAVVKVCPLEELERERVKVVAAEGRTVAVFYENGGVYALDNRCPHMGFPLHRGTVRDGILTCHWHHAKFDLQSGCTFDPFADDVPRFRAEVRDGFVWLDPHPQEEDPLQHWLGKLEEGLEQGISIVLAKSVIGLDELGGTIDVIEKAALFGIRNRARGWSTGLSILTALANVLPRLEPADRRLALYHGLLAVRRSTADQPPSFDLKPLRTEDDAPEPYRARFRRFIDLRAGDAAERTLRTAIRVGLPEHEVAGMIAAACTDHLYLDVGHALDFANKSFELLDHIGWRNAEHVLPSLIPGLVTAQRMEETPSWRHPIDVAELLFRVHRDLDDAIERGGGRGAEWQGHQGLAEMILSGEPAATLEEMLELVRTGVPLTELSAAVAYAAARRAVHFPTTNELPDWNSVHHAFTYANAVDQALRRAPSALLARGIFDAAMAVYLERFLNVPRRPIPSPTGRVPAPDHVAALFDTHSSVEEAGEAVAELAAAGRHDELIRLLGHVLLREDAGFHEFQIYEAGVRQYGNFAGRPAGDHVLIGAARFLAAMFPTVRMAHQTFDIASRLHRGETLYGEDDQ